nr:WhiB family transcriptional regulator [Actinopolyspora mortivallis]
MFTRKPACADETVDPELFFPVGIGFPGQISEARRVCGSCPVQNSCLSFALSTDVDGILGGTTRGERIAMRCDNRRNTDEVAA